MAQSNVPSAFVKSVLQNGSGRYICQLQRICIKFCKATAGSKGVRDFIENDLLEFTRTNPGVAVYLQPRHQGGPYLNAEYLNGEYVSQPVANCDNASVRHWMEHLRTRSGQQIVRFRKDWHTDSPSIQGHWTPATNRPTHLNLTEFPLKDDASVVKPVLEKSATERLMKLAQELRNKESTS